MGCNNSKSATDDIKAEALPIEPTVLDYKSIHSAVRWNKSQKEVEVLLTSNEAINIPDPVNGNCPIHIAAQNGHNDLVLLLINKKADLNTKNSKGNTAMHMAVGYDYYIAAKFLADAGADPEALNDLGFPARKGLEGDKCFGIAALISAVSADDVTNAFELCEQSISDVEKANFAAAGLKTKKRIGSELWTPAVQEKFKTILNQL
jgi:ankyrin repeat protein